jgi:hypothetical protein
VGIERFVIPTWSLHLSKIGVATMPGSTIATRMPKGFTS